MQLALAALAAAIVAAGIGRADVARQPLLVFTGARNGDGFTAYTVRPDGRDRRNLGASWTEVDYVALAWSPDGRRVALTGPQELAVASADGSWRRSLGLSDSEGVSSISWSPDGRRLAVDGSLVAASTGQTLLKIPGRLPTFSPRGDLLAFYGWPDWYPR